MGFGQRAPNAAQSRVGRLAGATPATTAGQGDQKRIRKIGWDEPADARKRRLRAKTINFSCTIGARVLLFVGVGYFFWKQYQWHGVINRGLIVAMLAMLADFGRVMAKMMTHGTK